MAWANYIRLMRLSPEHEANLRGLFKRAINVLKDAGAKQTIADLWLEWEKRFGTIQTLEQCLKHLKKHAPVPVVVAV